MTALTAAQLGAVDARRRHSGDEQSYPLTRLLQHLQRRRSALGREHVVAFPVQRPHRHRPHQDLIVYHEHRFPAVVLRRFRRRQHRR